MPAMDINSNDAHIQMERISSPHENDILCGRGGVTHYHPGNATFRALVNMNKPLYATLKKIQKAELSKGIVRSIRQQNPPGRFLVYEKEIGLWHDIGDKKAVEKTSQALREGQPHTKEKMTKIASMVPTEIPSTSDGFAELISSQTASIANQSDANAMNHLASLGQGNTYIKTAEKEIRTKRAQPSMTPSTQGRRLDRANGSLGLKIRTPEKEDLGTSKKSLNSSDMSIFSTTPSMKEMFTKMSTTSLDLDLADCASMGNESLMSMSIQNMDSEVQNRSKYSSDLSDDELRRAANHILVNDSEQNPSVSDFREIFRRNRMGVSDLTSSLSKMGVSSKNFGFKDSDFSIDTANSLKSLLKNDSFQGQASGSNKKDTQAKGSNQIIPEDMISPWGAGEDTAY